LPHRRQRCNGQHLHRPTLESACVLVLRTHPLVESSAPRDSQRSNGKRGPCLRQTTSPSSNPCLRGWHRDAVPSRPRGHHLDLISQRLHLIIRHSNGRAAECIRFDDVCTRLEVFAMKLDDDLRLRETKKIVVALHISVPVFESLTTVIFFL